MTVCSSGFSKSVSKIGVLYKLYVTPFAMGDSSQCIIGGGVFGVGKGGGNGDGVEELPLLSRSVDFDSTLTPFSARTIALRDAVCMLGRDLCGDDGGKEGGEGVMTGDG